MTRSEVIPGGDAILPGGMRSVIAALQEKIEEGEKESCIFIFVIITIYQEY